MDWIEHDGTCCPVPVGTWVEVRRADGTTRSLVIIGDPSHSPTGVSEQRGKVSNWRWDAICLYAPRYWHRRIIAYRIPSAHHIEAFRRIAENVRETENA